MDDLVVVVMITTPSGEVSRRIALELLERKLIACANILPSVRSLYTWKGELQEDEEVLMLCKTRSGCIGELCAVVRAQHPYELPEVIALPVYQGLHAYLEWVLKETEP